MKAKEWNALSKEVIKRDGGKCLKCAKRKALEVHHIVPRSKGGSDRSTNLITLCPSHHRRADIAYLKYGLTHYAKLMQQAAEWRTAREECSI